jgi:predicted NBD/HSP70 family sugar kinase
LLAGVAYIINILQPEIISLGGESARRGRAARPLREKANAQVFGGL